MPKQTFAACVTDHIEMCCISNQNDRSNGSFLLRLPLSCRLSSSLMHAPYELCIGDMRRTYGAGLFA